MPVKPNCSYCGRRAVLIRLSDPYLGDPLIWNCSNCDARVYCVSEDGSFVGRFADKETRAFRSELFNSVRSLTDKGVSRRLIYRVFASVMGISVSESFIKNYDKEQCIKAMDCLRSSVLEDWILASKINNLLVCLAENRRDLLRGFFWFITGASSPGDVIRAWNFIFSVGSLNIGFVNSYNPGQWIGLSDPWFNIGLVRIVSFSSGGVVYDLVIDRNPANPCYFLVRKNDKHLVAHGGAYGLFSVFDAVSEFIPGGFGSTTICDLEGWGDRESSGCYLNPSKISNLSSRDLGLVYSDGIRPSYVFNFDGGESFEYLCCGSVYAEERRILISRDPCALFNRDLELIRSGYSVNAVGGYTIGSFISKLPRKVRSEKSTPVSVADSNEDIPQERVIEW